MPSVDKILKLTKERKVAGKAKKATKKTAPFVTAFKSSEFVQDSGNDDKEESDEPSSENESLPDVRSAPAAKVNGKSALSLETDGSSEDESSSEGDSVSSEETESKKAKRDSKSSEKKPVEPAQQAKWVYQSQLQLRQNTLTPTKTANEDNGSKASKNSRVIYLYTAGRFCLGGR